MVPRVRISSRAASASRSRPARCARAANRTGAWHRGAHRSGGAPSSDHEGGEDEQGEEGEREQVLRGLAGEAGHGVGSCRALVPVVVVPGCARCWCVFSRARSARGGCVAVANERRTVGLRSGIRKFWRGSGAGSGKVRCAVGRRLRRAPSYSSRAVPGPTAIAAPAVRLAAPSKVLAHRGRGCEARRARREHGFASDACAALALGPARPGLHRSAHAVEAHTGFALGCRSRARPCGARGSQAGP